MALAAFADLPPIEEPSHVPEQLGNPYYMWDQQRAQGRSMSNYESEHNMILDPVKLQNYPSSFTMAVTPYPDVHYNNQDHRGSYQWPSAYAQPIKSENYIPWTVPTGSMPFPRPFEASRTNSIDGSNARSHSMSPVSVHYEREEDFPATPEAYGANDSWQYHNETLGGSGHGGVYTSPALSHNSAILSRLHNFQGMGIKLKDVHTSWVDTSTEQVPVFEDKTTRWEQIDYLRPEPEEMLLDRNSPMESSMSSNDGTKTPEATYSDCEDNDSASDYAPKQRSTQRTPKAKPSKSAARNRPKTKTRARPSRVSKRTPPKDTMTTETIMAVDGKAMCPHCQHSTANKSALNKHITTTHTRPFTCTFRRYGCPATFGSKNEWKRHVSSQHLRLGIWRCDIGQCYPHPSSSGNNNNNNNNDSDDDELIFNDFNRKDLFTQHLRRMHAPAGAAQGEGKQAFNATLEDITARCLVDIRSPPPRSVCGFCDGLEHIFEGTGAWETRMEHVGRHLESGHGEDKDWVEDYGLRDWMVSEGLLEWDASKQKFWLTGPAYVNAKGR